MQIKNINTLKMVDRINKEKTILDNLSLFYIPPEKVNGDSLMKNEFTCILCLSFAIKPILINCCDRIFCFNCSFKFLESIHFSCPFCRLKDIDFIFPNKMIMRILNNLKIDCPFSNIFLDDSGNTITCNDYIFHQCFMEHLLNKCQVKLKISSLVNENNNLSNIDINTGISRNKSISNIIKKIKINTQINSFNNCINLDNRLFLEAEEEVKDLIEKEKIKNISDKNKELYACVFLLINSYYCPKCDLPDLFSYHNCKEKKNITIKNEKQSGLLKFLTKNEMDKTSSKEPILTSLHNHPVYYCNFRGYENKNEIKCENYSWSCDFCLKNQFVPISTHSYICKVCDIDICTDCFSFTKLRKQNEKIHEHPLSVREDGFPWSCDICMVDYGERISHHCQKCDFDVCINCLYK